MFYSNKSEEEFIKLFNNPSSEYRGAPFWAWNKKLVKEELLEQIEHLKKMGLGGFHIHTRVGMDTEYLGKKFFEMVKECNDKAKEMDMLCWLYDEDKWPSGYAGGFITKDEKYRARFLIFTLKKYEIENIDFIEQYNSTGEVQRSNSRKLLARYEIVLKDSYLTYYKKLEDGEKPSKCGKIWYAYLEIAGDNPWFNNQAYVNALDKKAIDKFIEVTHEKYYQKLGEDFGNSIPAIFTDEPQFTHKQNLAYADEEKEIALPFTDDIIDTFQAAYDKDLLSHIPEIIWELPDGAVSTIRYLYHDHVSERFTEAFVDNVGNWCEEHGIMLTGHMMHEPTLYSQTIALGETMRTYRSFQLPGIDILCDRREFTTAKQAQSAAYQYGRPGTSSELYGVTNWDFDFRGHKLQGDWQAALGVIVRIHHLTWVSMEGEAKRDYPASIGYQSPWYQEYPLIEDHFSRLNTALTRGTPHIRVGVIHPVESYWLHWGPEDQTAIKREELETNFQNITEWLLFGLVDFNYISESLLPSQSDKIIDNKFTVGKMAYDVILVPGCETLRSSTIDRLEDFTNAGGEVIFVGELAEYVDAAKSNRVKKLAKDCQVIPFSKSKILQTLEDYREIDIRMDDGQRSDNLFYQMRIDKKNRWLFICHVNPMENPDLASIENITIKIKGSWQPQIYDTMTGEIYDIKAFHKNNHTLIEYKFSQHDSLLLQLKPLILDENKSNTEKYNFQNTVIDNKITTFNNVDSENIRLKGPVPITLSEPNVLLLDIAEYCFDYGKWQEREEILRIDNKFRNKLGYPLRRDAMAQPWLNKEKEEYKHTLSLKFKIKSKININDPVLALENVENTKIMLNEKIVPSKVDGWYVDKGIKKVQLPMIPAGESEIILHIPFISKTNVEWCYLLGDFGVKVMGTHKEIIEPVRKLYFGDWTVQGLPFYAGNVIYHCSINNDIENLIIEIPQFRNPLLVVSIDGERIGEIAFAPYRINIESIKKGQHIDITAYGNRINTFGTVHNCDNTYSWFGPDAWRTSGKSWSYEYQLKHMGILISPMVYTRGIIQKKSQHQVKNRLP